MGGYERVDVDQRLDGGVSGRGVGDDHPAVGVAGEDDRSGHCLEVAGEIGGITGDAPQWVGGDIDGVPVALKARDDTVPA